MNNMPVINGKLGEKKIQSIFYSLVLFNYNALWAVIFYVVTSSQRLSL